MEWFQAVLIAPKNVSSYLSEIRLKSFLQAESELPPILRVI